LKGGRRNERHAEIGFFLARLHTPDEVGAAAPWNPDVPVGKLRCRVAMEKVQPEEPTAESAPER
ncbi:MAG: hypothetical protein ACRD4Y_02140, partial [Candidatus Acidiferrales bacterium]